MYKGEYNKYSTYHLPCKYAHGYIILYYIFMDTLIKI